MTKRRRPGARGPLLGGCSLVLALIAAVLVVGSGVASADVSVVGQFGAGLLNIPGGVAVGPTGAIYVADTDNERIDQFSALHGFVGAWGFGVADGQAKFEACTTTCVQGVASAGDGGFHAPAGLAVDASSGDLYVADSQNNRIDEFSAAGSFVRAWGWGVADGLSQFEVCTAGCQAGNANSGAGGLSRPLGVTVDASGDVIVADSFNNRIEEYSAAGAFIRAWGTAGGGAGQFQEPSGVATDASGDVYVTDDLNYRVEEFSSTGGFIRAWGWGVADGSAMFETCTVSCQAGIVGSGTGQLNYPLSEPSALAVDAAGNIDVADFDNGRVQQFSSTGTFLEMWGWGVTDGKSQFETCTSGCHAGVNGNGSGGLWDPDGMAIDASGNIYVDNIGTNLVQEYADPDAPTTHTLSVTDAGTGAGTVASSPSGISCGVTCSAGFDAGATVTLTATPSGGSTFTGWSGGGCGGTSTCVVTMDADTTVTATFAAAAPVTHTLSVADAGAGTGTVASSPSGISCGATCSAGFDAGATVTLTATPSGGSTFTGWSGGGCSGTSTCVVTMDADTTVTATFAAAAPVTHTLSVTKTGDGAGTVQTIPAGIKCGATCSATFSAGTTVVLNPKALNGSVFAGWQNCPNWRADDSCVVDLSADQDMIAEFDTTSDYGLHNLFGRVSEQKRFGLGAAATPVVAVAGAKVSVVGAGVQGSAVTDAAGDYHLSWGRSVSASGPVWVPPCTHGCGLELKVTQGSKVLAERTLTYSAFSVKRVDVDASSPGGFVLQGSVNPPLEASATGEFTVRVVDSEGHVLASTSGRGYGHYRLLGYDPHSPAATKGVAAETVELLQSGIVTDIAHTVGIFPSGEPSLINLQAVHTHYGLHNLFGRVSEQKRFGLGAAATPVVAVAGAKVSVVGAGVQGSAVTDAAGDYHLSWGRSVSASGPVWVPPCTHGCGLELKVTQGSKVLAERTLTYSAFSVKRVDVDASSPGGFVLQGSVNPPLEASATGEFTVRVVDSEGHVLASTSGRGYGHYRLLGYDPHSPAATKGVAAETVELLQSGIVTDIAHTVGIFPSGEPSLINLQAVHTHYGLHNLFGRVSEQKRFGLGAAATPVVAVAGAKVSVVGAGVQGSAVTDAAGDYHLSWGRSVSASGPVWVPPCTHGCGLELKVTQGSKVLAERTLTYSAFSVKRVDVDASSPGGFVLQGSVNPPLEASATGEFTVRVVDSEGHVLASTSGRGYGHYRLLGYDPHSPAATKGVAAETVELLQSGIVTDIAHTVGIFPSGEPSLINLQATQ